MRLDLVQILAWGGSTSLTASALLALLSLARGRYARRLLSIRQIDDLDDLLELAALVPTLVAITGRVFAKRPLRCELSDQEAAIVHVSEERRLERRAATIWVGDSEPLRSSVREAEWGLSDGRRLVRVHRGRDAQGDCLQTTSDAFFPVAESVLGQLVGELSGRRTLGTRIRERALPIGATLTVIGELVATPAAVDGVGADGATAATAAASAGAAASAAGRAGAAGVPPSPGGTAAASSPTQAARPDPLFALRAPSDGSPLILSGKRVSEMARAAAADADACRAGAIAAGVAGVIMLAAAAARAAWTRSANRAAQRRAAEARRRRAAARAARKGGEGASGEAGGGPTDPVASAADDADPCTASGSEASHSLHDAPCVVCLDRDARLVFPGCGHLCVCSHCAPNLQACPICRARSVPIRVFAS